MITLTRKAVSQATETIGKALVICGKAENPPKSTADFLLQRHASALERSVDRTATEMACSYFATILERSKSFNAAALGVLAGVYMLLEAYELSSRERQERQSLDSLVEFLVYKYDGNEKMRAALNNLARVLLQGGVP